ncbi:hypothetical protein [Bifidobacterium ramosum]|uniref:hypothetical protein n=1 Tax=Bifidobacterium ramosum TaxID=1798158 RepID=UPI0014795718|nr:hypothetical protein [Bifidobacterium ramosum]
MNKSRTLATMSMLFAVISAMFAASDQRIGAIGFAIAAGLAGLLAGWKHDDD